MVETSRGLLVAIVAAAALFLVVGVDASMERTIDLQVEDGTGWSTIATMTDDHPRVPGETMLEKNRTDDVSFRLTVDNGYPLAYEEPYHVYTAGTSVATGTVIADARNSGEATFEVPVTALITPRDPADQGQWFVHVETHVGSTWMHGGFTIVEVDA